MTNSATSTAVGTAIAASPYSPLTALAEATWYFQVRERDAIGNWSDWSIARGVVLDLTGPAAPTVTGPVTPTRVTLPTWTWSGTGPFEIRYGTVNPPTTNVTPLTTGTFTPTKVLTDGTWYFQARESDALGNWGPWSASSSVVIKASAPTAPTVTPNKAVTNAPSWSWIKGSGGNGTFRYRWSGSPTYLNSNSTLPMSFALDVAASKDGSYTLCVAERDVVDWGAEGCATAVTFDKTKPVLSNISIPDGFVTNATSVTVKYDLDGATGQTSSYACSLTDGASTDCSKTVSDAAGNSGGTGTLKVWSRQKVIFVKAGVTGGDGSSWDKAYSDIQVGVAAIPSDGKPWEVWVSAAANAYQSFRFDRSNVSILGGFSATGRPNVNTDRSPSTNLSKIQNFYIGTSDPIPSSNITIDGFHVVDSKSASVGPDVTIFAVKNASIRNLWMENLTEGGNYGLITIWGGSVSLESVFLRGNHSAAHSAIYVYGESPQVSINKSEISGNTSDNASAADQATAGIFIDQTDGGKITIRNSTVSDNKIVDNNPLNGLANGGTIDISNSNVKGGRVTFGPYNEIDTPINWGTNCDPAATGCPTRP
ncbi:MAG: hypothetical protein ABI036_10485 [Fibrobacteria bacterium]